MTRIAALEPANANGRAAELLDATQRQLGRLPNLYKAMAQSPAALDAYLAFRAKLTTGSLPAHMAERIALLTATLNDCHYCVAAHTLRGARIGLSSDELALTRRASAGAPKEAGAMTFVQALVRQHGRVSDSQFSDVKAAGWSDAEIGEMVAHVALNVFSNYFNHVAEPELDFPPVARVL